MKKLMIAAAVAALTGVTLADSNIFDYKASVKYVDMQKKSIRIGGVPTICYLKVVKTASLTGYLVTDVTCPCTVDAGAATPKSGFLVVQNKAKKSGVKMFPANFYARAWQTSLNGNTGTAEGYLFAGKGAIAAVANPTAAQNFGDAASAATSKLFGAFNSQDAVGTFRDAWLDAAGFGKAKWNTDPDDGCVVGATTFCVQSLSGSVIGGLFLCEQNKFGLTVQDSFLCKKWADTSDVISGTWSIKVSNLAKADELTALETALVTAASTADIIKGVKAAATKIDRNFKLVDWAAKAENTAFVGAWF